MESLIPEISITGIDGDGVDISPHKPGAFILPIKLQQKAEGRWEAIFYGEHKRCGHSKKRKIIIEGDKIVVDVLSTSDLQEQYDIIKEVVESTNRKVMRTNSEISVRNSERQSKIEESKQSIKNMKEKALKIKT